MYIFFCTYELILYLNKAYDDDDDDDSGEWLVFFGHEWDTCNG